MFRSVRQCARLATTLSTRATAPARTVSSVVSRFSRQTSSTNSLFALSPAAQTTFNAPRRWMSDASAKPKLSQEAVQERVLTVCKNFDKLTKDKLSLESNFMSDLGLDSLDHVELVMAFEDEFGYEISDTDGEKLVRPADVVKFVIQKQSSPDAVLKSW